MKAVRVVPTRSAHDAAGLNYFGIAASSTGIAHVIWGEADGSSLYCCGDVWYTKGS